MIPLLIHSQQDRSLLLTATVPVVPRLDERVSMFSDDLKRRICGKVVRVEHHIHAARHVTVLIWLDETDY